MLEFIKSLFTEIGTVGKVYTEVDYYVYIKAVEYLIAIGFFVLYSLFWKKVFKPDHWAKEHGAWKHNAALWFLLGASLLIPGSVLAAAPADPGAPAAPASVTIGDLARIYRSVEFDHAMHVDLAEGCETCHHHTTGSPVAGSPCVACHGGKGKAATVSCKGCHLPEPFTSEALRAKEADITRYHLDKPGLKGAYHLGCLGCHKEMGAPTGCRECHALSVEGEAFYRLDAKQKEGTP